ncbi:uncharacterized protein LOC142589806 [Dermacentor variabilis]|uniref:uncharacterized protein LOC142589806 n=1 Tax=Dermacentor variabilis TaxID=34621 RepID=UPI003F5C7D2C
MRALFACLFCIFLVASLLPDLSEEAVGVEEVRLHHELCHYGEYRIEDGKSLELANPCVRLTCESLNASYANVFIAGCGVVALGNDVPDLCKIRKPKRRKPYPGCCPRIVCRRKRKVNSNAE